LKIYRAPDWFQSETILFAVRQRLAYRVGEAQLPTRGQAQSALRVDPKYNTVTDFSTRAKTMPIGKIMQVAKKMDQPR